jgi:DNA-directed RNA polymerase subunit delta
MSFIEIAYELLVEKKQAVPFSELLDEIAAIKNLSEQEVRERVAQFYTDLNIDGRYMALGENRWGLRFWYPVDHIEEEVVPVVKPKKKKAKKVKDEDLDDFDEVEEEEDLEFDEFEEDDLLDDEFEEDEIEDESEDEDILEDDDDYDLEDEIEEDELELEDEEEEEL